MGKVELRIAFRQAGLGTLAHANVLNDGEEIVDAAVKLAHAADREISPDDAAVLAQVALLDAIAAGLAGERPLQYREVGCKIVRVCNVLKGLALEFLAGKPEHAGKTVIDPQERSVGIDQQDPHRRIFERRA